MIGLDAVLKAMDTQLLALQNATGAVIDTTVMDYVQLAMDYCPYKSGYMQDHITSSPSEQQEAMVVGTAGIPDGEVDYAIFVEFGHFTRNRRSYVAPNPFLEKALTEIQPFFVSGMESITL